MGAKRSMNTKKIVEDARGVLYGNIYVEDGKLGAANRALLTSRRVIVPSNPYYYGFWNWDGAFHMIGAALFGDRELAVDQAETMFALQFGDGMFIDCAKVDGSRVADFSKPPVWPWAFECTDRLIGLGEEYLEGAIHKLDTNMKWWERERFDGTLFSYKVHPYESGMDDSPRFDKPIRMEDLWAVDANGFMYSAYKSMAYLAGRLGKDAYKKELLEKADRLLENINTLLFSEELSAYCDYDKKNGSFTGHLTPMSFVPLFAGCADADKAASMAKLAADKEYFYMGMPTAAYNDPCFDSKLFWRGPCWLNTAYFAVKGLADYGYGELALAYCRNILSMIEKEGIWEYYDTRKYCGIGQKNFGWSSVFSVLFVRLYEELGGE